MGNKAYIELLKDPRWQKKRLRILELDYWRCRQCENKDDTLHVHHLYYTKNTDPWDYPDSALITLCDKCHEQAHSIKWQQAFLDLNCTPDQLLSIALAIKLKIQKHTIAIDDVLKKYKTRVNPVYCINLEGDFSETNDEMFEYFHFVKNSKPHYYAN